MTKNLNSNDAWKLLFEKYDILHEVKTNQIFRLLEYQFNDVQTTQG